MAPHIPSLLSQIQKENHTKMKKVQRYKSIEIQKYKSIEILKDMETGSGRAYSSRRFFLPILHLQSCPSSIHHRKIQNVFASYSLPTVLLLCRSRVAEISKYPKETEHLTRWEDFGENPVLSYNNLLH